MAKEKIKAQVRLVDPQTGHTQLLELSAELEQYDEKTQTLNLKTEQGFAVITINFSKE